MLRFLFDIIQGFVSLTFQRNMLLYIITISYTFLYNSSLALPPPVHPVFWYGPAVQVNRPVYSFSTMIKEGGNQVMPSSPVTL